MSNATKLELWSERVKAGEAKGEAALAVGYAEVTARTKTGWLTRQAIEKGFLPDPEKAREVTARREQLMEEHLDELAEMLGLIRQKIRAVLEAEPVRAAALIAGIQLRMMEEVQNRTIGRPPVHIHGHKDGDEEQDREIVVRVIHGEKDGS